MKVELNSNQPKHRDKMAKGKKGLLISCCPASYGLSQADALTHNSTRNALPRLETSNLPRHRHRQVPEERPAATALRQRAPGRPSRPPWQRHHQGEEAQVAPEPQGQVTAGEEPGARRGHRREDGPQGPEEQRAGQGHTVEEEDVGRAKQGDSESRGGQEEQGRRGRCGCGRVLCRYG